jgi:hypothetical protein
MLSKMASFGIAGLMIVGGTVALGAPAEAAAKKCAVGTWTLTSTASTTVATVDGDVATVKLTGGAGTKLKITTSTAVYDFAKSKPVYVATKVSGAPVKLKYTYRKTLKYGIKLTGAAKGTLTPKIKTVSGPATVNTVALPSTNLGTERVATVVKKGEDGFVIGVPVASTCTKTALTLSQKFKSADGTSLNLKIVYRRTK